MTEHEKILKTVEKHKSFFEHSESDVAISTKGIYIFFNYSKKYDDYWDFIIFHTAEELERIITDSVATCLCMSIENTVEVLDKTLNPKSYLTTPMTPDDYCVDQNRLTKMFSVLAESLTYAYENIHPLEKWFKERLSE